MDDRAQSTQTKKLVRQIQRRDSSTNWKHENPVLAAGEIGYDTTEKKMKIGDGTTLWNDLKYIAENTVISIGDGTTSSDNSPENSYLDGKILFSDPTFIKSNNSLTNYGNAVIGTATTDSSNPFNGNILPVSIVAATSDNTNGGGVQWDSLIPVRPNATFIFKIIASIPTGYTLYFKHDDNAFGTTPIREWRTDRNGTGQYSEYVLKIVCDNDTTSNNITGVFYVKNSSAITETKIWNIAYATCIDTTALWDVSTEDKSGVYSASGILSTIYSTEGATTVETVGSLKAGSILKDVKIWELFDYIFGLKSLRIAVNPILSGLTKTPTGDPETGQTVTVTKISGTITLNDTKTIQSITLYKNDIVFSSNYTIQSSSSTQHNFYFSFSDSITTNTTYKIEVVANVKNFVNGVEDGTSTSYSFSKSIAVSFAERRKSTYYGMMSGATQQKVLALFSSGGSLKSNAGYNLKSTFSISNTDASDVWILTTQNASTISTKVGALTKDLWSKTSGVKVERMYTTGTCNNSYYLYIITGQAKGDVEYTLS